MMLDACSRSSARAASGAENVPNGPAHPGPEPCLVHGPLLRGRVHPPPRPVHGEVAAVRARARRAGCSATAACSRCVRGHADEEAFIDRVHDPRARRGDRHVLRGRPLADRARSAIEARPGIGRLALESGAPVVPVAILGSHQVRNWKRLRFPRVIVRYGKPIVFERVSRAHGSSSSRSPTRSCAGSAACTRSSPRPAVMAHEARENRRCLV